MNKQTINHIIEIAKKLLKKDEKDNGIVSKQLKEYIDKEYTNCKALKKLSTKSIGWILRVSGLFEAEYKWNSTYKQTLNHWKLRK